MKDCNGKDITLSLLARYMDSYSWQIVDYLRKIRKVEIPSNDDYILDAAEIKMISPVIYNSLINNNFTLPATYFLNKETIEQKLGLKPGVLYKSPYSQKSYRYCRCESYFKKKLDDWSFEFQIGYHNSIIIRKDPFDYGYELKSFNIKEIVQLELVPKDGVLMNLHDCFFSREHNEFLIYTVRGCINRYYYFENPFKKEIKLTDSEIQKLIKIDKWDCHALCRHEISEIRSEKNGRIEIYSRAVVGHYRGEDSGAIYPEFDDELNCVYDLDPLFKQYNVDSELSFREKMSIICQMVNCPQDLYELLCLYPQYCIIGQPIYNPPPVPI